MFHVAYAHRLHLILLLHCSCGVLFAHRLLTMDRLHGVPLTDLASIRSMTQDPEQTLITALNTWFGSVLGCETFHADVHAGMSAHQEVF